MGLLNPVTTVLPLRDSLQGRDRSGPFSATATGPVRYDDDGLIIEPGTTNYVPNPVAGVNTTGWVPNANTIINRITSLPAPLPDRLGPLVTTGFEVVATADISTANVALAGTPATLNAAVPHSHSWYVYVPAAFSGTQINGVAASFNGATNITNGTADLQIRDVWQQISGTVTPDAGDLVGAFSLRLNGGTMFAGERIVFSCVAVQPESVPSSPAVGSMGPGYSWAGTPHYSASVRAATVLTFDPAGRVDNDSFAMVGRFSLDSITDGWQAIASAGKQDIGNFFGVFNRDDGRFSAKSNGGYAEDSLTFTPGSPQIAYVAGKDTDWIGQLDDNTPITDTRSDGGAWSNSNVYIGSTNNGDYLNGSVGPIAFYDRPLTDVELDKVKAAISLGRNPWGLLAPKKQYSFFQLRPGV